MRGGGGEGGFPKIRAPIWGNYTATASAAKSCAELEPLKPPGGSHPDQNFEDLSLWTYHMPFEPFKPLKPKPRIVDDSEPSETPRRSLILVEPSIAPRKPSKSLASQGTFGFGV